MLPLYKKGEESQRPFIDDLVLLIVQKGCSFYAWLRSYVWHDFLWGGMSCAWYFLSFRAFDQRSITLYDETYIWGVHFALCECSTFIMITLDLWIRKGVLGQFSCCYHFLILDWEVTKHVIIGVFEAKWTIRVGLASQFISLCEEYGLINKSYVMWEMKRQICLQWQLSLNQLGVLIIWGFNTIRRIFVLAMPFF